MALRLPAGRESTLAVFLSLPDRDYASLRAAFDDIAPSISIEDLASRAAAKAMLEPEKVNGIVWLLSSMYAAFDRSDEEDLAEFVRSVCETARKSDNDELRAISDWDSAQSRVLDFLSLHDSLGLSAKGFDVVRETERLYCRGRILTDLRPVFLPSGGQPDMRASVVIHSLRIAYHVGPTREIENIFIGIETDDLIDLRNMIDRALLKDKKLRTFADSSGVPSLPFEYDED